MAKNNGEIGAAFRFREIRNKITNIGWINFIKWYLITIVLTIALGIALIIAVVYISVFIQNIINFNISKFLLAMIIAPLFMYVCRSAVLFYMSGGMGFLVCEECGGYYELKQGESPEDFDTCQCGGKLKYIQMPSNKFDKTDDNNDNKSSNHKKRNLTIIILLALGITAVSGVIYFTHVLNPTPTNYTLLGSYNVNNLSNGSKGVNIPQGTKNIKVEYNISWVDPGNLNSGFYLYAYDVYIGEGETAGMLNMVADKNIKLKKEQTKTGTYYFTKPPVKSIILNGNGIQGTVNIYTTQ